MNRRDFLAGLGASAVVVPLVDKLPIVEVVEPVAKVAPKLLSASSVSAMQVRELQKIYDVYQTQTDMWGSKNEKAL